MRESYSLTTNRLKGEYKAAFETVEKYRIASLIEDEDIDSRMIDLVEKLQNAQDFGEPVSTVVGPDVERFCWGFFSECEMRSHLESVLRASHRMVWVVFIFTVIELALEAAGRGLSARGGIEPACIFAGLACGILLNVAAYLAMRPLMRLLPKVRASLWTKLPTAVLLISLAVFIKFGPAWNLRFPAWGLLLVSGTYLAVYYVLKVKTDRRRRD